MSRGPMCRVGIVIRVLAGTALFLGCRDAAESPAGPESISLAGGGGGKPVSGPSVTSASPAFGNAGEVGKQVTIRGSGFTPGAQAAWERGGVPDRKVTVVSTEFVSSTELVATITIASDADLDLYDISVTALDRKKGIGYALFEVTQAIAIIGTETAFGVNENGEATGRIGPPGAFFWSLSSGLEVVGSPGRTFDISEDGLTLAGFTGVCCYGAFVQARSGGIWNLTVLPKDPASGYAAAKAIASDPVTGAAVVVGGLEGYASKGNNLNRKPRLWYPGPSGWTRVELPAPSGFADSPLFDVNAAGVAVGIVVDRAAVWDPNGVGGWTQSLIGPTGSGASGVNTAGTIVVGFVGGGSTAQYWQRSGSSWTASGLAGGCSQAVAIDDLGRILANDCPNGNRRTPAVISPPYGAANVRLLGGLGSATGNLPVAYGLSRYGTWIVGEASLKGATVGVRWMGF